MKYAKPIVLLVALAFVAVMFSACAVCQKKPLKEETVSEPPAMTTAATPAPEPKMEESQLATEALAVGSKLEAVYFDFDKYDLKDEARETLAKNAQLLKDNPGLVLRLEGNCDERGSNEYNLALGERRANSAKKYLVYLGISPDRLETISYGEEKPLCREHNEDCWWKNRRVDSVIISK